VTRPSGSGNDHAALAPFRLGLVVDSMMQPQWVVDAVRAVTESVSNGPSAILAAVTLLESSPRPKPRRSLVRRLYDWIDRSRARPALQLFDRVDLQQITGDQSLYDRIAPLESGELPPVAHSLIASRKLDLILLASGAIQPSALTSLSSLGTCVFVLSDYCLHGDPLDGLREVLSRRTVLGTRLELYTAESATPVDIVETITNTHPFSASYSEVEAARHAIPLLERLVRRLRGELPHSRYRVDNTLERVREARAAVVRETIGELTALTRDYASNLVRRRHEIDRWEIAWAWTGPDTDATRPETKLEAYTALRPPEGCFWADPFPCRVGDRYFVFFEELRFTDRRGYIRAVEAGADGPVGEVITVLDRPFHLSYPFVFEHDGDLYMVPESALEGRVELYRATHAPWEWTLDRVMLHNVKLIDATIAKIEGTWWLFACQYAPGLREWNDLVLYHAPSPFGPWSAHAANPVVSDARSARPGGRLFQWNGSWYRPAQDCSRTYGGALTFRRITRLTATEYEEDEAFRIDADAANDIVGVHTYNRDGSLAMIDIKRDS
jgi:hypothetical protein